MRPVAALFLPSRSRSRGKPRRETFMPRAMAVVAYERAKSATLSAALSSYATGTPIVIAVGPEGGLTAEEVESARELGAHIVSLGPTILRTETAAAALLAQRRSRSVGVKGMFEGAGR